MKFHNIIDDVLGTTAKVKILRALLNEVKLEHSSREIALLSHISLPQTLEILGTFESYGIVRSRTVGRAIVWTLNKDSRVLRIIADLYEKEESILKELKQIISKNLCPICEEVILYGSVSKGEEKLDSDLDIFILVKNDKSKKDIERKLADLQNSILMEFNIPISSSIFTRKEFEAKKSTKFIKEVVQGEKLCV